MAADDTGQGALIVMDLERVWAVIPAYNTAPYIADVIQATSMHLPLSRIIVVDDGSNDGSGEEARKAGAFVLSHPRNFGKGEALKSGYKYALDKGAEWIVSLDSDMQHDPASLSDFFTAASGGEADLIIGKRRITGSKMPLDRRLSNWTSSALLSLVVGQRLFDIQCGYRMVRGASLAGVECRSNRYDFEIELLLRLIERGARIGWVVVPTRYSGEPSSIHRVGDTLRFLKWVIRYLFRSL